MYFGKAHGSDLAENDIVGRHFLDIGHPAIENGKCIGKDRRARYQRLEAGALKTLVVFELRAARKGIGNAFMRRRP